MEIIKQNIDDMQWGEISEEYQSILCEYKPEELKLVHITDYFTIGVLIQLSRHFVQIDIYTVHGQWAVQLFEKNVAPNDVGVSCIYETAKNELVDALWESIIWLMDNDK